MADEIGRGVIRLSLDGEEIAVGIADVKQAITSLEAVAQASARNTSEAFASAGTGVNAAVGQMDAATKRWVASIEREIAAVSNSRSEFRQWEAQLKNIPQSVYDPLIAKLEQARAAQAKFADDKTFAKKLADAEKLNKAGEYINFWKQKIDEMDAKEKALKNSNSFLEAMQKRVDAIQMAAMKPNEIMNRQIAAQEAEASRLGVSRQAAPMIAQLRAQAAAMDKGSLSAKQMSQALRLLPAQFTDIFTSVASGMPLWLILIQQGGQIKDSFGGVANAFREVSRVISDAVTIGRLFVGTVVGAVVAGISGWIFALQSAQKEMNGLNQALIMTGRFSGASAIGFIEMANRMSQVNGTVGKNVEALTLLASTGRIANESMESIGRAAVAMERATGQAISKTVEQFVQLSKEPYEASIRLNEQYHYLTDSVIRQIDALEKEGRMREAAAVAMKAFADAMEQRANAVVENLGWIEKGWLKVKDAIALAVDWVKAFGREKSPGDALRDARQELSVAEGQLFGRLCFCASSCGFR